MSERLLRLRELLERLVEANIDGLIIRVCSREALLTMKRSSTRERDREDVAALEAPERGPD